MIEELTLMSNTTSDPLTVVRILWPWKQAPIPIPISPITRPRLCPSRHHSLSHPTLPLPSPPLLRPRPLLLSPIHQQRQRRRQAHDNQTLHEPILKHLVPYILARHPTTTRTPKIMIPITTRHRPRAIIPMVQPLLPNRGPRIVLRVLYRRVQKVRQPLAHTAELASRALPCTILVVVAYRIDFPS